jgi:hypothetical protein
MLNKKLRKTYFNLTLPLLKVESNTILNSSCGRPSLTNIKNNYKKVDNVQDINESFIGKEVIVLYKYPKLLFGNYHQDILYYGIFTKSPKNNYETHIWIKDYKRTEPGLISKKRFYGENPLLTLFILKMPS